MAMAFPGPSRKSSQRLAAEIWAAIASGLGGRLFEALRDKRSLAYTVVASSWQKGRGGALVTYIATAPEREEEARSAMLEELSRFAADRVTADELNRARNYLAGQVDVERSRLRLWLQRSSRPGSLAMACPTWKEQRTAIGP
jgi:zinc protease